MKKRTKWGLDVSSKTSLYCNLMIQWEYTSIALFPSGLDYGLGLSLVYSACKREIDCISNCSLDYASIVHGWQRGHGAESKVSCLIISYLFDPNKWKYQTLQSHLNQRLMKKNPLFCPAGMELWANNYGNWDTIFG